MRINNERLKNSMLEIGNIGKDPTGGITRLAFSPEYNIAARRLGQMMEDAGLKVNQDPLGTVFGRRDGEDDTLPAIMFGSHLDTVKNGGFFDGLLGIMAGLEVINTLNDLGRTTKYPLELVAFNAEEGSEMGGTFASRVMAGLISPDDQYLQEHLPEYNLSREDLVNARRDLDKIKAFIEVHIEQGTVLESEQIPIGIVNGIAGITRYKVNIFGEANHSGTTPMKLRKDALVTAAELILRVEAMALELGEPFVATIGTLAVKPGAVNVIPGEVELIIELRDLDQNKIETAGEKITALAAELNADLRVEKIVNKTPVKTDENISRLIESACKRLDISGRPILSGAGHDAKEIARKVPTGMIFVPSIAGKSHCPEEKTDWEDIYLGTEVLLETIIFISDNG